MPSKINLIGPKLKVARARRHTRDLSSLLDTFITDNPHRIEFCETSKGLEVISHFETPLPIETAAILYQRSFAPTHMGPFAYPD